MYDHHILIFGQNSLLLHGGVPRIERLRVPSFCVLSQQNTYQASCILGESVSQRNFLVRDKKKFPSLEAECRNFYFWHSQSLLSGILFVSGSNLNFDKNFKLLSILEKFN